MMFMQRQALQVCLAVLGVVTVVIGVLGMMGVDNPLYRSVQLPRESLLDTNMRFYSGVWLVLGLTVLATVRSLEKHFALYRVLWGMIFVGGIGRLLSLLIVGTPPLFIIGLMLLELFGSPVFLWWHQRVATAAQR
jgi:hypothetical protein